MSVPVVHNDKPWQGDTEVLYMPNAEHKIFISHGKPDAWLAQQLAKEIRARGAKTFLDETD